MYLFIDTISTPNTVILFDEKRILIDQHSWPEKHQEFDMLIEVIDTLLDKNWVHYSKLTWIVAIVWPGSFTGTRVTTLVVNTLGLSFKTPLFPVTIPEFLELQATPLPWILPITKKESLVWRTKNTSANLENNVELQAEKFSWVSPIDGLSIVYALDYQKVVQNIPLTNPHKKIQPMYAKEPNITMRKI